MYDRQTDSLWSQVRCQAVTGIMAGKKLEVLPSTLTTWEKWLKKHPETEVLSLDTGFDRDYSKDPYADYYATPKSFFSFFTSESEEDKMLVSGITFKGKAKAYPLELLRRQKKIEDSIAGTPLTIYFDPETDQIEILTDPGSTLVPMILYWFVWKAIYPETHLFAGSK